MNEFLMEYQSYILFYMVGVVVNFIIGRITSYNVCYTKLLRNKMNEKDYLINARKTLSTKEDLLEHMAYGLITESAEIMDALKKHKFYGRELDVRNLKEEIA